MNEQNNLFKAMVALGIFLAIGMSAAAFILGVQGKRAMSGQQSITVKGLAEKPIKADSAEWELSVSVTQPTQAEALEKLAVERKVVEEFLLAQGFEAKTWSVDVETLNPHYEGWL